MFEVYSERAQHLSKMATGEEKAFAMLEFHSHQFVIIVQRHFRTKFEKYAPCATPFGDGMRNLKLQDASGSVAVGRIIRN